MEGGVGAFTRELAQALASAGHEIHIITNRKARPSHDDRRWWALQEPVPVAYGHLHPRVRRWWWSAMNTIAEIAVSYDLDIVNVQYQAAAYDMRVPAIHFLPWRLRGVCRTAVTFHDLRVPYLFPKAGRLRHWVVHRLAAQADGAVVTNRADYEALIGAGISESTLCRIPIGSNISVNVPEPAEVAAVLEKLGVSTDHFLIGYFGFLNESKGADTLLNALAGMEKRFHLVFIGGQTGDSDPANNAAFRTGLEALIKELGLQERVHWSGFLPEQEVSAYRQAADLMVLPYRDGVSLRRGTLMAALAHGRPIITTEPAVPITELIPGENIWDVPVDDPAALAKAIHNLAADSSLRRRLGSGAAAVAGLFSWDKIAEQTAGFFRGLLANGE
jgi:glycosyltransferase involved in cell wall biosynthesis